MTGKRVAQVGVKMTESDLALIRKAAAKQWPNAVMSLSSIVLSLTRMKAKEILRD